MSIFERRTYKFYAFLFHNKISEKDIWITEKNLKNSQ